MTGTDKKLGPGAADMRHATLCYIVDGDRVLLGEKLRGIGQGLYNGPGGKVEDGETPREAAVREAEEELGVTPRGLTKRGELRFVFGPDPFQHVHVYVADGYSGEPAASDEMAPQWFPLDALPYDAMWPDDRYWMPLCFDGHRFHATFRFDADGDTLHDYELVRGHHQHPAPPEEQTYVKK